MAAPRVFLLNCAAQNYAWGKIGRQSEVAKLSETGNPTFQVENDTPYAELWMGTHPKAPSIIANDSSQPLSDWLSANQEALGSQVKDAFNGNLPFLFKVLSVNKSLSIQAHPNKSHAEQLHKSRPKEYPDDNHKPEMAIALTEFEGMCGFRPIQQIAEFIKSVPEFAAVLGKVAADDLVAVAGSGDATSIQNRLKTCFTNLMTCNADTLQRELSSLVARLQESAKRGEDMSAIEGELLLRLNSQFPGDVGCFCTYFLNHMRLQPGQAMFLEANLPHAYLDGDCLECMATSDNVVRAGLTPKFKDVPTLCEMLKYEPKSAQENLFPSVQDTTDPYLTIYNPPIRDFAVSRIQLPAGVGEYTLAPVDSASLFLVIQGEAEGLNESLGGATLPFRRGQVVFAAANQGINLKVKSQGFVVFRAYCQL